MGLIEYKDSHVVLQILIINDQSYWLWTETN